MPLRMNLCLAASSEGVGASKIDRPLGAARSAQREDTGTVYFACWEGDRSPPIPFLKKSMGGCPQQARTQTLFHS